MKYLLIFAWFILATIYLAIERTSKVIISLVIILWELKYDQKHHKFHKKYIIIVPLIFFAAFECQNLKDFYTIKNWNLITIQ